MHSIVVIFTLVLAYASAQDSDCDFSQDAEVGVTYNVCNPSYPSNYQPGAQCRWILTCPVGYKCRLDCLEVHMPQSPDCSMDRLLVSRSGDPQLAGAEQYCGEDSFSAVSTARRISIGLITAGNSTGGRLMCTAQAQQAVTADPGLLGLSTTK